MSISPPRRGYMFWPVGNGDSTTVFIDEGVVMEVDLNHLECSAEEGDPHAPVIEDLIKLLPTVDGKPYLSLFALTHPDQDHCRGFARLLDEVTIGELWFTPRVFRDYKVDLCDDAIAFKEEAMRRVKATIKAGGAADAGDRVRIVGYDDLLKEDDFEGFPKERLTIPGTPVTEIDGEDRNDVFRAFVHSPFKDDCDGERNETSLGLQVRLLSGENVGEAMLLGDLSYPTVKRIFDVSDADDVRWNVLLAPHHCSKSVMYQRDPETGSEHLCQDVLDDIEKNMSTPGYIVSSSEPIPASNSSGDNPPHAKAKARYEEIVRDEFLCTQEHPSTTAPSPIIFDVGDGGLVKRAEAAKAKVAAGATALSRAVEAARGGSSPPQDRVGFGLWR